MDAKTLDELSIDDYVEIQSVIMALMRKLDY